MYICLAAMLSYVCKYRCVCTFVCKYACVCAGVVASVAPVWVSRLVLQCLAAPLAGVSSAILTTPLDAIRARIQVLTLLHFAYTIAVSYCSRINYFSFIKWGLKYCLFGFCTKLSTYAMLGNIITLDIYIM